MPESVTDRPTKSHEQVFLFSKNPRYYFDQEAVREPHAPDGRKITGRTSTDMTHENHRLAEGERRERWPGAGRNIRSVWEIATQPYPEAHFATFPEELPRRCIAAGCPEWVCATCGKARERETEVTYENPGNRSTNGPRSEERKHMEFGTAGFAQRLEKRTETTGWSDCGHDDYRPGVVLDPFMGSGTTALVARKLGRRAVGIELSPEYAALCARRLQQQSLFA